MGGELFVMDDGWFGDKYPRKNDSSSLGDWVVDKNKLPNGIECLLSDAKKHGVKFGIWIEPEMANTTSELYEKHPDWVLKASERDVVLGRGGTQVVLDLANPAVQDFVFGVVDNLMTSYPEIDYIKWDANMSVQNHGSQYLTKDNQSHMYIEFHRGFEKICQRIRAKYPNCTTGRMVLYSAMAFLQRAFSSSVIFLGWISIPKRPLMATSIRYFRGMVRNV